MEDEVVFCSSVVSKLDGSQDVISEVTMQQITFQPQAAQAIDLQKTGNYCLGHEVERAL